MLLQAEKMNAQLFQQLRLPPRQMQLTAAAAEYWRGRREALNTDLCRAVAPLSTLPTLSTLPHAGVLALCGLQLPTSLAASDVDDSSADIQSTSRRVSRLLTLSSSNSSATEWPDHAAAHACAHACAQRARDAGVISDLDAEVDAGVCAACGVYGCSQHLCGCACCVDACCADAWQQRLLGCDPAASAAARAALRRLRAYQDADSRLFADMQRAVRMPGCLFTVEQLVGGLPTALQHAVPVVDWLRVCQTAAGECRAGALRADAEAMGWAI